MIRNRISFAVVLWLIAIVTTACLSSSPVSETAPDPTATPTPPEPTETPLPTPPDKSLFVDPGHGMGDINPYVLGTNFGPWAALTLDNMDLYANSGVTLIRFPGGHWGDANKIRSYHVDQLISTAEMAGADVTISARLHEGTPEDAAELVHYTNIEKEYGVEYWSIGNEPSLYATQQQSPEWTTEYYNEQWRIFAEAMLEVDPTIKLLGPDTHQFTAVDANNPKDENGLDWMREFLRANGDMVDIVAFHRYPFPTSKNDPIPTIEQLRNNSQEWDDIIPALRAMIQEEVGHDLPIAVMEVNSNWSSAAGADATPDSHFNAIWWADVLGRMIEQDVEMVAQFALTSQSSGWAMMNRTEPRPTYYVYQLLKQHGEQRVASHSDLEHISIYSAVRDDGALTMMIVNLRDDAAEVPLVIANSSFPLEATQQLLTPDNFDETQVGITLTETILLPGQSITFIVVDEW